MNKFEKNGGRRKGAGRKPSDATIVAQAFKAALARRVGMRAWRYLDAMEDLALGHYVERLDENGNPIKVYKTAPDREAIRDVLDRFIGKPAQNIEGLSEEGGGSAVFVIMRGGAEIGTTPEEPEPDDDYETKRLKTIEFEADSPLEAKAEVIEENKEV
jgi:hypothetical protein